MSLEKRGQSPFINRGQQCSIKNCLKQAFCKTFCAMHYARFIKTGDPNLNLSGRYVGKRNTCIIDGVGVVEGYGYCRKHYKAYKKYGDPLIKKRLNYGKYRYTKDGIYCLE